MKCFTFLSFTCVAGLSAASFIEHESSLRSQKDDIAAQTRSKRLLITTPGRLIRRDPMNGDRRNQGQARPPTGRDQRAGSSGRNQGQDRPPPAGRGQGSSRSGPNQNQARRPPPGQSQGASSSGTGQRQNSGVTSAQGPRRNARTPQSGSNRPINDGRTVSGPHPPRHAGPIQPSAARSSGPSRPPMNTNVPSRLPATRNDQQQRPPAQTGQPYRPPRNTGPQSNLAGRLAPQDGTPTAHASALSLGGHGHYVTSAERGNPLVSPRNRVPIPTRYPSSNVPARISSVSTAHAGVLVPHAPPATTSIVSTGGAYGAATTVNAPRGSHAYLVSLRDGSPPRVHNIPSGTGQPITIDQRSPSRRATQHHTTLVGPGAVLSQGLGTPGLPDGATGPDWERFQQIRNQRPSAAEMTRGYTAAAA